MAEPTYHELRKAFLEAIRPMVEELHPEALDALDAFAAYERPAKQETPHIEREAPQKAHAHEWLKNKVKEHHLEDAPKRAQTTIRNQERKGRMCVNCACISNSAYPYWFRTAEGVWSMKCPPCTNPASTDSESSTDQ